MIEVGKDYTINTVYDYSNMSGSGEDKDTLIISTGAHLFGCELFSHSTMCQLIFDGTGSNKKLSLYSGGGEATIITLTVPPGTLKVKFKKSGSDPNPVVINVVNGKITLSANDSNTRVVYYSEVSLSCDAGGLYRGNDNRYLENTSNFEIIDGPTEESKEYNYTNNKIAGRDYRIKDKSIRAFGLSPTNDTIHHNGQYETSNYKPQYFNFIKSIDGNNKYYTKDISELTEPCLVFEFSHLTYILNNVDSRERSQGTNDNNQLKVTNVYLKCNKNALTIKQLLYKNNQLQEISMFPNNQTILNYLSWGSCISTLNGYVSGIINFDYAPQNINFNLLSDSSNKFYLTKTYTIVGQTVSYRQIDAYSGITNGPGGIGEEYSHISAINSGPGRFVNTPSTGSGSIDFGETYFFIQGSTNPYGYGGQYTPSFFNFTLQIENKSEHPVITGTGSTNRNPYNPSFIQATTDDDRYGYYNKLLVSYNYSSNINQIKYGQSFSTYNRSDAQIALEENSVSTGYGTSNKGGIFTLTGGKTNDKFYAIVPLSYINE